MDLRRIVAPVNRFINVADDKTLKSLVIGGKLNEFTEGVLAIRE